MVQIRGGLAPVLAVFCAAALLSLAAGARGQEQISPLQDDRQEDTFEAEWVHGLSRATFSGDEVEASLFVADEAVYAESVGVMAFVIILVGTVMCVGGCAGACVRFIVADKDKKEEGTSYAIALVTRVLLVMIPVLIFITMIVGIVGNSYMLGPQTFFKEQLEAEAEENAGLYDGLTEATDNTVLGQDWRGSGRTFSATYLSLSTVFVETNASVISQADDGAALLESSETGRIVCFIIVWVCAVVALFISCAAAAFSIPELAQATALCSFLMVVLMATNLAGHFVINVVVADICFDIRQYDADSDPSGVAARVRDRNVAFNNERETGKASAIAYDKAAVWDQYVKCPIYNNSRNVIDQITNELRNDTVFELPKFNCSSCCVGQNCSACASAQCQSLQDDLVTIDNTLTVIQYLTDCQWTERVFDNRLANNEDECDGDECGQLCGVAITGLVMIYSVSFVMMLLFCCLGCLGIVGDTSLHFKS